MSALDTSCKKEAARCLRVRIPGFTLAAFRRYGGEELTESESPSGLGVAAGETGIVALEVSVWGRSGRASGGEGRGEEETAGRGGRMRRTEGRDLLGYNDDDLVRRDVVAEGGACAEPKEDGG